MELEVPWSERQQEVLGNQRRVGGNRGGWETRLVWSRKNLAKSVQKKNDENEA